MPDEKQEIKKQGDLNAGKTGPVPGAIPIVRLLVAAGVSFGLLAVFAVLKYVFKIL